LETSLYSNSIHDFPSPILDDGIYDPQEIATILLERGMRSNEKRGYWTSKPESEFDMMLDRVFDPFQVFTGREKTVL